MEFCRNKPPTRLLKSPVSAIKSFDGVKFIAKNGSWLMLRGSGTEPILRIYAEAASDLEANRLLVLGNRIARMVWVSDATNPSHFALSFGTIDTIVSRARNLIGTTDGRSAHT